jgi:hypothetical protein
MTPPPVLARAKLLPPVPLWDWRDQTTCCICAQHWMILTTSDRRFLWRLDRRRYPPSRVQITRLEGIVEQLDVYALDRGIVWP